MKLFRLAAKKYIQLLLEEEFLLHQIVTMDDFVPKEVKRHLNIQNLLQIQSTINIIFFLICRSGTFPMMASKPPHKAAPLGTAANNIQATLPIIANVSNKFFR